MKVQLLRKEPGPYCIARRIPESRPTGQDLTSPAPLRQREIALFFFPLLLNVQLMSVSHTFINGALARLEDYVTALAGMSIAMVVHLFIASPSYQNHTITIAMVRGRRSLRGVLIFVGLSRWWKSW